jgi:hypothetical protein
MEKFEILHSPLGKEIWLDLYLQKDDLRRLRLSEQAALIETDLQQDFDLTAPDAGPTSASDDVPYRQEVVREMTKKLRQGAQSFGPHSAPQQLIDLRSLRQAATRRFYGSFCPRKGSLNFFAISGQNSLRTSHPTSCIIP